MKWKTLSELVNITNGPILKFLRLLVLYGDADKTSDLPYPLTPRRAPRIIKPRINEEQARILASCLARTTKVLGSEREMGKTPCMKGKNKTA